jgi:alanyl-tRNA synthetase
MASRPTSGTSSRSSTSSGQSAEEVRAHSAVHVLRGAIARVIGPRNLTSVGAGEVRLRSEKPLSSEEASKIEAAANSKIAEDAEILEFNMERQEAEGHFGTDIYDLDPVSDARALLKIVRISEWDVTNCSRAHVGSTGAIGPIRVDGAAFDAPGKEVELRFHLL